MKHTIKIFSLIILIGLITFTSCKDDEPSPAALNLSSLMSGTVDLDGALPATDVSVSEDIVAEFSTNVDEATAIAANITLKRGTETIATTITVDGNTVTIDPDVDLFTGTEYDLSISSEVTSDKGVAFGASAVSFTTEGIGLGTAPQSASQVLYLQFNGSIEDVTGNATKASEQVAYTADRFGVANGAANFRGATANGNGDIVELSGTTFVNASTTISVWYKVALADYTGSRFMFGDAVERGYFLEVGGDLGWMKFATSHEVVGGTPVHNFGTAWTDPNGDGSIGGQTLFDYTGSLQTLTDGVWVQLVMTYDATTSLKTIFINGAKIMQVDIDLDATEWILKGLQIADVNDANETITGSDTKLALGYAGSKLNTSTGWAVYADNQNSYKGLMDDLRIWNKALTESEVTTLYNSENP